MSHVAQPVKRGPHHQAHASNQEKASADAHALHKALKGGIFTDGDGVFGVLCRRTAAQIADIRRAYLTEIKRDLLQDVKDNTRGHFEDVCKALVMTPAEYDAYRIHRAIQGLGTDEQQLIEILAHRTPAEVKAFNESYQQQFGKSALQAIQDDVSGDLGELFSYLSNPTNERKMPKDADSQIEVDVRALYEASQGKMIGHDVKPFIKIFGQNSKEYLHRVYTTYVNKHGVTLEKVITGWTFQGHLEHTLLAIITPPAEYYSNLLYKAMKGAGTDDNSLIRIIVTQRERHLAEIADHFMHTHKKALKEYVKDETSGDYRSALIALLEFYADAH